MTKKQERGSAKRFWTLKECLQHRWDHTQPDEEQRQSSAGASRPDPQAEYWDRVYTTYDHYKDLKEGSCIKP